MRHLPLLLVVGVLISLSVGVAGLSASESAMEDAGLSSSLYLSQVKPLLDKRCVVCHSCYNSPCQLKLSSYEGVDRGGSKEAVYNAQRLWTMEPTRLFVDGATTDEWREKNFHAVREESSVGQNDSLLMKVLAQKDKVKASNCSDDIAQDCNSFRPEEETLTCASTVAEMDSYFAKHPNRGMPYGFPPLKVEEFNLIRDWLAAGGQGPTPAEQQRMTAVADSDKDAVAVWETFFNAMPADQVLGAKYRMTARYLYEHLFLAHISFAPESGNFYELVRSRTPPGEAIDIIPTVRPYDDPGVESVYYRFRRLHSTIVHKTHMVFMLTPDRLERFHRLFIEPDWVSPPTVMGYDRKTSANPFLVFAQIPPESRYRFLLDNSRYIIMTFIRGPVCKGQVALNVIQEHFWLLFRDPEHDLTVQDPGFLLENGHLATMPTEQGSFFSLFKSFNIPHYKRLATRYVAARQNLYARHYREQGPGIEAIWAGEKKGDMPALTVFRHFNSASVHEGLLGDLPRTVWVMDYPLLERIYYALVAGFDVYGSMGHQLAVRLYMDNLRQEGETYFLDFLPKRMRPVLMRSWYGGLDPATIHYQPSPLAAGFRFTSMEPKRELLEHLVRKRFNTSLGIGFDENYHPAGVGYPSSLPESYPDEHAYIRGFDSVSAPGTNFFSAIGDHNANLAYVRIRIAPGHDEVLSVVVHRWHDDVLTLSREEEKLNHNRDVVDFIRGYVGSYPNYFFDVPLDELSDFLVMLKTYDPDDRKSLALLRKYGINRADDDFWEAYDWFQADFLAKNPLMGGLFDLNRYYHLALGEETVGR